MNTPLRTIVVHDGKFHADDITAVAVLGILLGMRGETYQIIRTRDTEIIARGDFVCDIGGLHDPAMNRFDHHQKGGAGMRENGIPYASIGLVWATYGDVITGNPEITRRLDMRLFAPIDADDNGYPLVDMRGSIAQYRLQESLYAYRATWKESVSEYDRMFPILVDRMKELILREIVVARDILEAETLVRNAYNEASDKRLIILDGNYPFEYTLSEYAEPLYVVAPRPDGVNWKVATITKTPFTFENRKNLPAAWAGLRDEELVAITGVAGSIFCHNGLFLAVTDSKESAIALATLALNS